MGLDVSLQTSKAHRYSLIRAILIHLSECIIPRLATYDIYNFLASLCRRAGSFESYCPKQRRQAGFFVSWPISYGILQVPLPHNTTQIYMSLLLLIYFQKL